MGMPVFVSDGLVALPLYLRGIAGLGVLGLPASDMAEYACINARVPLRV